MLAEPLATYVNAAAKKISNKNKIYSNISGVLSCAKALGSHRVKTAKEIITSHLNMNVKNMYRDTSDVRCREYVVSEHSAIYLYSNAMGA